MKTYTDAQAARMLARILDRAEQDGEVRIRRRDGTLFALRPEPKASPLDVPGLNLPISVAEIVRLVREGRGPIRPPIELKGGLKARRRRRRAS